MTTLLPGKKSGTTR